MFSSKRGCHPQRHEISREIQVDPGASIIMCPAKSAGHDLSGAGISSVLMMLMSIEEVVLQTRLEGGTPQDDFIS